MNVLEDRPCKTCGSPNHGTGAHDKLRALYVDREAELEAQLHIVQHELNEIRSDLRKLDRRPSERR